MLRGDEEGFEASIRMAPYTSATAETKEEAMQELAEKLNLSISDLEILYEEKNRPATVALGPGEVLAIVLTSSSGRKIRLEVGSNLLSIQDFEIGQDGYEYQMGWLDVLDVIDENNAD